VPLEIFLEVAGNSGPSLKEMEVILEAARNTFPDVVVITTISTNVSSINYSLPSPLLP
jgi:hypothetical protein